MHLLLNSIIIKSYKVACNIFKNATFADKRKLRIKHVGVAINLSSILSVFILNCLSGVELQYACM